LALKCFVEKRDCNEDAGQHDFLVIEAVFGNIAVDVEDSSVKLLFWYAFVSGFNGSGNLVLV
jgi:hypothetical protein